jgi:hypothetical protein
VIIYLRNKGDSLGPYLRDWGSTLGPQLEAIEYGEISSWRELPSATYVFSQLEAMNPAQRAEATHLWDRLAHGPARVRLLNDPRRALGRYDLLRMLHERGINEHRAYRLREAYRARLPVFLRRDRTHWGVTRLIRSRSELVRGLVWTARRGWPMDQLLVVEFTETVDAEGLYHKYGAFYVDGRVVPRGLAFKPEWMVKVADRPQTPNWRHVELEREYLETNPHASWIRDVFAASSIDYGRIDYSMRGDRPVIWEINTNPSPIASVPVPDHLHPHVRHFAEAFGDALGSLDTLEADPVEVRGR